MPRHQLRRSDPSGPGSRVWFIFCLGLIGLLIFHASGADRGAYAVVQASMSDHFDGELFFNPESRIPPPSPPGEQPRRGLSGWIWRWVFGNDWPEWPKIQEDARREVPVDRVPKGSLVVTPVGHGTFLIQLDGINLLTDPIWSERCSPVSWAGPKRHRNPGIRFEELPRIDAVLVSHNHYDHLDLPTLKRLAGTGVKRSVTTLGNRDLIMETGIAAVEELDWWQSVRLSDEVSVTVVPAQHFSSRTLWDRNRTLWGGFVISGPSGNVFYAGDTGYGPHFREIARRFSPIRVALLPIAPFRPQNSTEPPYSRYPRVHMGPSEAVQAHTDLRSGMSIAAHFQVFQLGGDGFDDAVNELKSALAEQGLKPEAFVAPSPGRAVGLMDSSDMEAGLLSLREAGEKSTRLR